MAAGPKGDLPQERHLLSPWRILVPDGHLAEAQGDDPQEEAPDVLPVGLLDGMTRPHGQASAGIAPSNVSSLKILLAVPPSQRAHI